MGYLMYCAKMEEEAQLAKLHHSPYLNQCTGYTRAALVELASHISSSFSRELHLNAAAQNGAAQEGNAWKGEPLPIFEFDGRKDQEFLDALVKVTGAPPGDANRSADDFSKALTEAFAIGNVYALSKDEIDNADKERYMLLRGLMEEFTPNLLFLLRKAGLDDEEHDEWGLREHYTPLEGHQLVHPYDLLVAANPLMYVNKIWRSSEKGQAYYIWRLTNAFA